VWEFKHIKDVYLRFVAPRNLFLKFIHEVRSTTLLPIKRTPEVFKFIKDLKGVGLNGGVQISALQPFCHRGTPDILSRLSWNPH